MQPTTFQPAQLYGSNGQLIREGAYGQETPFVDDKGTGWSDYVNNNLEYLNNVATGEIVPVATLPSSGVTGKRYLVTSGTNAGKLYIWTGTAWVETQDAASRAEAAAQTATTKASQAATSATNAANSATAASNSASAANTSKNQAATSATNAASSATAAAGSATNANASKVAAETAKDNAVDAKTAAEQANTSAQAALADADETLQEVQALLAAATVNAYWNASTTYQAGDCVLTSDGSSYRCLQTSTNNPPATSPAYWTPIQMAMLATFEYDSDGDLMPRVTPANSAYWEIDSDGDITPV